ncbi:MAG TPA: 6-pyruvoyl-tetrahydropterin synthase-related protein [Patescibacteria group bacterium]|nr:6-pyruvoyl-tetrahydropterin synthase-related protein [Patescibacteria group bacterium]
MIEKLLNFIKKITSNLFKKDCFFIVFLLLIMLFLTGNFFSGYLQSDIVGGWDGQNHYAVVKNYSENIFPNAFGWSFSWNAGMPWPLGYNPFFSYLMAILFHLIPLSSILIFKLFFIILTFLFPVLVYYIAKKIKLEKIYAFLSGFLAILFLTIFPQEISRMGVTIRATFLSGLYPQFFASFLYLIWLNFFIIFKKRKIYYFFSILFLGLIILSNTHVAEFALITLLAFALKDFLYSKKWLVLKKYFLHLIVAFGLVCFWAFPLLSSLNYFPHKTFKSCSLSDLSALFGILFLIFISGFVFIKSKKKHLTAFFMTFVITLLLVIVPIKKLLPSIPWQPFRLLPLLLLSFLFLLPALIRKFEKYVNLKYLFLILILFLYFSVTWSFMPSPLTNAFFMLNSEKETVDFIKEQNKGRSIMEMSGYAMHPLAYNMSASVSLGSGHQTIWNVFRESSISSVFVAPLRNTFSAMHEDFGVVCMLCDKDKSLSFYKQPFLNHIKRAELYNIKYFAVNSFKMVNLMLDKFSNKFTLLKAFDPWELFSDISNKEVDQLLDIAQKRESPFVPWYIFEYKKDLSKAVVLDKEPALIFTELKSKNRPYKGEDSYNWLRFGEEWFFQSDFKTFFVHPNNLYLDKTNDLKDFKIVVVEDYLYKNIDLAYNKLRQYAKNNKLVFLVPEKDKDPLLKRFEKDNLANTYFIKKNNNPRLLVPQLIDFLNDFDLSINSQAILMDYQEEADKVFIDLNSKGQGLKKVYIKNSYFPFWQDSNKGRVYMASPSLQLVVTNKDEIKLKFNKNKDNVLIIGTIISILSILYLFKISLINSKNKN